MQQMADSFKLFHSDFIINILCYGTILIPSAFLIYCVKRKYRKNPESAPCLLKIFALDHKPVDFTTVIKSFTKFRHTGIQNYDEESLINKSEEISVKSVSTHITPKDKRYYPTLIFCFLGLQLVFLTWGLVQEKIITRPYQRIKIPYGMDKFDDSQFLVFTNKLSGFFLASLWIITRSLIRYKRRISISTTHLSEVKSHVTYPALYRFSFASLSNILSSWCQYEALKYVSFPTQVLFKSGKIIPVMVIGKLLSKKSKRYAPHEYICAAFVSLGIAAFLISRKGQTTDKHDHHHISAITKIFNLNDIPIIDKEILQSKFPPAIKRNIHSLTLPNLENTPIENNNTQMPLLLRVKRSPYFTALPSTNWFSWTTFCGILILSGYVIFDSFTSNWQSELFERYNSQSREIKIISSWDMMCYVNLFSSIFTAIALALRHTKGEGMSGLGYSINFARTHESAFLLDLMTLSLCSALGQIFIFTTISAFGAVTFITAMTIRQGFAVLLSCFVYGHKINALGLSGILLVFAALFAKIKLSSRARRKASQNKAKIVGLGEGAQNGFIGSGRLPHTTGESLEHKLAHLWRSWMRMLTFQRKIIRRRLTSIFVSKSESSDISISQNQQLLHDKLGDTDHSKLIV